MSGPFYVDRLTPACLIARTLPGAAREAAARVEAQLMNVLTGWKEEDGWSIDVHLTLHRPTGCEGAEVDRTPTTMAESSLGRRLDRMNGRPL